MLTKQDIIQNFDPNSLGQPNGNFMGLPFDIHTADIILLPIPWDVTVSYADGTSRGPQNILDESLQLDLLDLDVPNAWKTGIHTLPVSPEWLKKNDKYRKLAKQHIKALEKGEPLKTSQKKRLQQINEACNQLRQWVFDSTHTLLQNGKIVGLIGGEHSTPLGYIQALAQHHQFGILQIDAHCDLRPAYEDFDYSHASIMYNVLKTTPNVTRLVQVGIRDLCEQEYNYVRNANGRVVTFFDRDIKNYQYTQPGANWKGFTQKIIDSLPDKVYVSFDIDGLDPRYCPSTGTPVPGGLEFAEASFLLQQIVQSGKTIIGFDLNEVGSQTSWDGNVGARILYKLCNFTAKSQNKL
jgi:agmatinase